MDPNFFENHIVPSEWHVEVGVRLTCQKWPNLGVNGLIHGISVPRHLLNDTNILYITKFNVYKHLEVIFEVLLTLFYNLTFFHFGVSEQDLGCFLGKQFRLWGIGTKALPE